MKIIKPVSLVLTLCFLFSGCSLNESLADLAIVEAVGIDYKQGEASVALQYLNLEKSNGTTDALSGGITSVATGSASSISSAIASISTALSQEAFFGQNKIIVFGRDYVENGADKGLDYLLRSIDSRPDVLVAMSDGSAEEVIKNPLSGARIPAESLHDLLKTGERNGFGAVVTVNDMLNMYADKTSDMYLPVISPNESSCACGGIAIFCGDKYKATLSRAQALGFLIMQNKTEAGFVNVEEEALGKISLEMLSSSAENSLTVTENSYTFICNIKMDLTLDEVEKGITAAIDEKKIQSIEALVNKKITELCTAAFNECISNECDVLSIGKYLARENPQKYNAVKDNWRQELSKIRIKVSVKSNLEKVNDTALRG